MKTEAKIVKHGHSLYLLIDDKKVFKEMDLKEGNKVLIDVEEKINLEPEMMEYECVCGYHFYSADPDELYCPSCNCEDKNSFVEITSK